MNINTKIIGAGSVALIAVILIALKISSSKEPDAPPILETRSAARSENSPNKNAVIMLNSAGELASGDPLPDDPMLAAAEMEKRRALAIDKMNEAATSYDAAELPVIQPYLVCSDQALRTAALDAMIVLGDASASPMLRDAAKNLESEEEVKKMVKAADYLELPPANFKQISEKMKKAKEAKKKP